MEKRFIEAPEISVNADTCVQCSSCIKICPIRVFSLANDGQIQTKRYEECVLCGQCICGCSTNSIIHSGFEMKNFKRILPSEPLRPETVFAFLSQRRSVRNYKKETPSKELLEKIIQVAGYAPGSPHHRVGWVRNMTVVSGTDNMKVVLDMTANYMEKSLKLLNSNFLKIVSKFSDAAKAGISVIPDLEMRLNEYKQGKDSIIYQAPAAIFFHAPVRSSMPQVDCDTACMLIQLYAESHGLGTCWNGLIQGAAAGDHLRNFKQLSEFLRIPKDHKCYAAITIGFPSITLHSIPERKVEIDWITKMS